MEYITIFEAIVRTGLSDSTIRRAISAGRIKANKDEYGQYRIGIDQLDKLRTKDDHALTQQRLSMLQALVDSHDLRIAQLEQEIATLKTDVHPIHQDSPIIAPQPQQVSSRAIRHPSTTELSDLPPGTIALYLFADLIGVKRRTLRDFVISNNLPYIAIPNPDRPHEMLRYVTPEQQAAIKRHRGI